MFASFLEEVPTAFAWFGLLHLYAGFFQFTQVFVRNSTEVAQSLYDVFEHDFGEVLILELLTKIIRLFLLFNNFDCLIWPALIDSVALLIEVLIIF